MTKKAFEATRRQFLSLGGASLAALALRGTEDRGLRQQLASDRHRPQYHIVPPAHYLNDPNGPLYWRGRYHLFYQYAPGGSMFSTKYWYHVVSEDMVHWRNLGVAVAPTPGGPDKDGCWSGSAVIHNGVPTLVYTGACFTGANEQVDRAAGLIPERQLVAVAADPDDPDLRVWKKIRENPVIATPPDGMTVAGWRDPALWRDGDIWYMVIGSGVRGVGGMALLYRSPDLRQWEYLHPLATAKADPALPGGGAMWECPDFFYLDGKPILLVAAGNRYLTGTYRDLRFQRESEGRIDYGSAYAQKTFEDARGRRIWWGWVTEGPGASRDAGWSGAISLPRVLTLRDGRLHVEPASEVTSLRSTRRAFESLQVDDESPLLLRGLQGDCTEIVAHIDLGTAEQVGLRVRSTPDGSEQTLIGYDRTERVLFSDTRQSNRNASAPAPTATPGPRSRPLKKGALDLVAGDVLRLRILLDASVIETFANDRTAIIDRVYPSSTEALGIGVFARGGSAAVRSLEVWDLKPISNDRLTSGPLD
ncbi:MAG: glycoside hydrolase family 32 protein [Vicinamibacteraceae bacterium]|nr:glycoside hydrolase family 32 protein [Vicinamibacteraceae bacterium]